MFFGEEEVEKVVDIFDLTN